MKTRLTLPLAPRPPQGAVIYRGPSALTGAPIVCVLTGLRHASANEKTGEALPTYILDAASHPVEAARTGAAASVCGGCVHMDTSAGGAGTCYVNLAHGPSPVWRAVQAGTYPTLAPSALTQHVQGRMVRLGTYGDPAAVPLAVWTELLSGSCRYIGYTHQWRAQRFQGLKAYVMASCETPEHVTRARALGWRTYRIRRPNDPLMPGEIVCPASDEASHRLTCDQCGICDGTARVGPSAASPCIVAHGAPNKRPRLIDLIGRLRAHRGWRGKVDGRGHGKPRKPRS